MLFPVKHVHPLLSSHIKIYPHICLELYVLACKRCLICAYFSPDSDGMTFSLLWIMDLKASIKNALMDLFLTNTKLHSMFNCGLMWCFISCLDSHSDGTHSLQGSTDEQEMQCYLSPNMKKLTHLQYTLDGLRVRIFFNYSFNTRSWSYYELIHQCIVFFKEISAITVNIMTGE